MTLLLPTRTHSSQWESSAFLGREPREGAEEIVAKYMRPCVRFRTEDCIDLPPVSYIDLTVDLVIDRVKQALLHGPRKSAGDAKAAA